MNAVFLFIALVLNSLAHFFLKIGAMQGFSFYNIRLFSGLAIFAVSAGFYFLSLRTTPLSTAFPVIIFGSFLLTSIVSYYYLNENIGLWQWVGYLLIVLGLVFVFYFSGKQ